MFPYPFCPYPQLLLFLRVAWQPASRSNRYQNQKMAKRARKSPSGRKSVPMSAPFLERWSKDLSITRQTLTCRGIRIGRWFWALWRKSSLPDWYSKKLAATSFTESNILEARWNCSGWTRKSDARLLWESSKASKYRRSKEIEWNELLRIFSSCFRFRFLSSYLGRNCLFL